MRGECVNFLWCQYVAYNKMFATIVKKVNKLDKRHINDAYMRWGQYEARTVACAGWEMWSSVTLDNDFAGTI